MDHKRFEKWLFSDAPLGEREQQSFQEHLHACASCRRLSDAFREVENELRMAPMAVPAPGFVTRWQQRLVRVQEAQQAKLTRWVLIIHSLSAVVLAILLAVLWVFSFQSLNQVITAPIYDVTLVYSLFNAARDLTLALLRVMPPFWWANFAAVLSMFCLLWVFTLSRYSFAKRSLT